MLPIHWVYIREHERGLLFHRGVFERLLLPGRTLIFDPLGRKGLERVSVREANFEHRDLEVIVRSGALAGQALVLDLKDHERALVWVDGRMDSVRGPGLHALWTAFHEVRAEVVDSRPVCFEHPELPVILQASGARTQLETAVVATGWVGLIFQDGRYVGTLPPGVHAFWRHEGNVRVLTVDLRERSADVAGQEIMTADKVTLRLNAMVTFRVADPVMPGDMKEILNRVTEARKAAEATLVTRREETAAIRSQANTARIFESNPTLMRLRELEVLEKVAEKSNLSIVLGDGGLAERVVKLL